MLGTMGVGRAAQVKAEQAHQLVFAHKENIEVEGLGVADNPSNCDQERMVEADQVAVEGSSADMAAIELDYTVVLGWTGIQDSAADHIVVEMPARIDLIDHLDIVEGRSE
jgi:hypothetical protein